MRLFVTEKAQKDLARLDKQTQNRIKTALDNMAKDINTVDLCKLKGSADGWRLRVGD
ncbi:MAG: type II toxin-antitoxin system RelE family toxin [Dethiobacteria bacterium]|jgi:mRNA-degrading endonuclease RelE of RelBE toxin-antitoxin system